MNQTNVLAPVVLFVYNRPYHARETLSALARNHLASDSILYIYSDGPRSEEDEVLVDLVRETIHKATGFKKIVHIERTENFGLSKNVIHGVSDVILKHGNVIVMEDDLKTSPHFLSFMNEALNFYESNKQVFSITGFNNPPHQMYIREDYPHDVWFSDRCSSWSWGTWVEEWLAADWNPASDIFEDKDLAKRFLKGGDDLIDIFNANQKGSINSWWINWQLTHCIHDAVAMYPVESHVNNIGLDGSGTHNEMKDDFQSNLTFGKEYNQFISDTTVDDQIMNEYRKLVQKTPLDRVKRAVKDVIRYDWLKAKLLQRG